MFWVGAYFKTSNDVVQSQFVFYYKNYLNLITKLIN